MDTVFLNCRMDMPAEWQPLWLSVKLGLLTTCILIVTGVPLAYWLSYTRSGMKPILEAVISLPLVLPPSVLGFYMLLLFSPRSGFGYFLKEYLDVTLVFSTEGLVLASVLYSLPFMVHPVQSGFQHLSPSLTEAAYTLGVSPLRTFIHILVPGIRASLLTGIVLTFAHTLGEFGVVVMIGGNIPGVTNVASIAIYDQVESMNYPAAHSLALVLLCFSFLLLSVLFCVNKKTIFRNQWI